MDDGTYDGTGSSAAAHGGAAGLERRTVLKLGAALAGLGVLGSARAPQAYAETLPSARAAAETDLLYLSGTDKDNRVDWGFRIGSGRQAGVQSTIPVPSNWETVGFGTYSWGFSARPDEIGYYDHTFEVPEAWRGTQVSLVFEGSMTDTTATVNGVPAGPTHQGGFYRFAYDISALLTYGGSNRLDVEVRKDSTNDSVNRAERQGDYWAFGGIFRPVYLMSRPVQHLERIAVDGQADGRFTVDVFTVGVTDADTVSAQIVGLDGTPVGAAFSAPAVAGTGSVRLATRVDTPRQWTAETPDLYRVEVSLLRGGQEVHRLGERFGFRTVEVRPRDGIYVNGRKIYLRGTGRHEFWPDSGRATSPAINRADVQAMKDANLNTVRMVHYPQAVDFYDACDELGLYVLDEIAGWQKAYDTPTAKRLLPGMVTRDVNHPSIILWCNANEGGWNTAIDGDFALYDPQGRKVIHPWAIFNEIDTDHYESYASTVSKLNSGRIFLPTEFLHCMYDGGGGAGLEDYDDAMRRYPNGAGGILWAWLDEGVVRDDQGGRIDTTGNSGPDGIVGHYRQREGSYYAVRDIWSPLQASPVRLSSRGGSTRVRIENRYAFTDAVDCTFRYELRSFPEPAEDAVDVVQFAGVLAAREIGGGRGIAPQSAGELVFRLPPGRARAADALALTAVDPTGREIYTWVWPLTTAGERARRAVARPRRTPAVTAQQTGAAVTLTGGNTEITINRATGRLSGVRRGGSAVSLTNGPVVVSGATQNAALTGFTTTADGRDQVVEATYDGDLQLVRWTMRGDGWIQLDYRYQLTGPQPFFGVTFSYPVAQAQGITWLGAGPYRVYKNRLRGVTEGVHRKAFNDTATGAKDWVYPEFKGYHADTSWALLRTAEGSITVVSEQEDLYLRLFTPAVGGDPRFTAVPYPAGDISFLDAIPGIGDKFQSAASTGPRGVDPVAAGTYSRTIYLRFGG